MAMSQVCTNGPEKATQPRPKFARRNSMNAPSAEEVSTCEKEDCDNALEEVEPEAEAKKASPPPPAVEKSVARICGPSKSKCGYCGGKRMHVLGIEDEFNKAIFSGGGASKNNDPNREATSPGSTETERKNGDHVEETKTSKSYGLLFDRLPYGTYEDLINRGWRRSGKLLYRPHNHESCCPAISIRLDVLRFASRCNSVLPTNGSDFSRAILLPGSKSQRKVGKTILRAFESHNSKCVNSNVVANHADFGASASFKGRHSILPNDDSVHASHVAKMQLGDNSTAEEKANSDSKQVGASCQSEPKHPNKKSRRLSPNHDRLDENPLTAKRIQQNLPAKSKNASSVGQQSQPLFLNPECLQPLLDKLSRVVYQSITNEAMKSVALSCQGRACGKDKPEWAWWTTDDTDEKRSLPKWCSFKISQPPTGPKAAKNTDAGFTATASTSACAAACGRSRGCIDKQLLVRLVVDSLKRFCSDNTQQNDKTNELQLKEVSCHEKSGHVHVTFGAPSSATATCIIPPKSTASKTNHQPPKQKSPTKDADELDPIAEFITRHKLITHKINRLDKALLTQTRTPQQKRFLTVRSVPAHESSLQLEVHQLFCRYQTAVHGDFDPFFGTGEASSEKAEVHDYAYYHQRKLQGFLDVDVAYSHLDEVSRSKIKTSYVTFYRFLCETPVHQDEVPSGFDDNMSNEDGYDVHVPFGTYHQQYRLSTSKDAFDGPLIAVGVVDILPQSVSSVYAFYDPTLSSLELGKYTALREIEWVRRASQFRPELHFYYLGYYIHSCRKMTYKAEYKPSELLCPVHLKWVEYETAKKRLEEFSPVRHCCALYADSSSEEDSDDAKPKCTIDDIALDIGERGPHIVHVGMLNPSGREFIEPHVNEFVSEVGIDMCSKFIIKLR